MKWLSLRGCCAFNGLLALSFLMNVSAVYGCDKAQLVDYDYQVRTLLGNGYASSGRIWLLDEKLSCINSLNYGVCLTVKPVDKFVEITVSIAKDVSTSATFTQQISYNASEVL